MFSKHFHERLFERCGIVLDLEQTVALRHSLLIALEQEPPEPHEESVWLDVRLGIERFTVVYVPSRRLVVTAHKGRPRKFKHRKADTSHHHSKTEQKRIRDRRGYRQKDSRPVDA